jgi:hypothetical protein
MTNWKYWVVRYGADCDETGDTYDIAYIRTSWGGFPAQDSCAAELLADWCRERFGRQVRYVQGVAPCLHWRISPSITAEWQEAKRRKWGGEPTTALRLSIVMRPGDRHEVVSEEKNPTTPATPTYEDLALENAELKSRLSPHEPGAE